MHPRSQSHSRWYTASSQIEELDSDDMKYVIINSDISLTHKQLEAFLYGYNWDKGQDKTRPLSKLAYDILKR